MEKHQDAKPEEHPPKAQAQPPHTMGSEPPGQPRDRVAQRRQDLFHTFPHFRLGLWASITASAPWATRKNPSIRERLWTPRLWHAARSKPHGGACRVGCKDIRR